MEEIGNQKKIQSILNLKHEWEKSRLGFLNTFTRYLVSYFVSLIFLVTGVFLFISNVSIQGKLLFLGFTILIFLSSYLIHRQMFNSIKEDRIKRTLFMLLLGNVFGFLFNLIYFVVVLGNGYGLHLSLGGIGDLMLRKSDGLNMVEGMYSLVFSFILIVLMMISISYGLSLRDRFSQEKNKLMTMVSYAVAVTAGFFTFLFVLLLVAYPKLYNLFIYLTVGSMFFIYAENLFTKKLFYGRL
ncbi:MAG: hypothetical protein Q7S11_03845 [bacterium]|nr:hypothetical protein [bacterium]